MRPDRSLIASVVFLAIGLGFLFGYCHGTAGLSAAIPVSGASFNLCVTTTGPGALGGFALTVLGVLLLLWATLCAIVGQVRLVFAGRKKVEQAKDVAEKE
ncbi:MAG TPA: hypothetical protein VGE83_04280 [Terracidiphilus sp.]|jgi:hypothetical protein